jgi:hypothetical protein
MQNIGASFAQMGGIMFQNAHWSMWCELTYLVMSLKNPSTLMVNQDDSIPCWCHCNSDGDHRVDKYQASFHEQCYIKPICQQIICMDRFPHLYALVCSTHVMDLVLKDCLQQ